MVSARRPLPVAPPGLWDRTDMSEALTRRDMSQILKVYRQWTGATQTQIAAACEIPQSHVSEIQNSRRQVTSMEIFERFADGIGIPRRRLGLADKSPSNGPEPSAPAVGVDVPVEVERIYPNRGAVPSELWRSLFRSAGTQIDILVISGLFLPDGHPELVPAIKSRGEEGVKVRYALSAPTSSAVAIRGEEEGIGANLAARTNLSLSYLSDLRGAAGVEVRLHATTLYNSIYRFDADMLVNTHVYGAPAVRSPVLHLRDVGPGGMFGHYAASFERVWATTEGAW